MCAISLFPRLSHLVTFDFSHLLEFQVPHGLNNKLTGPWLADTQNWVIPITVEHSSLTFHDDEDGGGGGDGHGHVSSNVIILIFEAAHESGDYVKYLA